jgi:hypothetical protein
VQPTSNSRKNFTHTPYLLWTCPELHKLVMFTNSNNATLGSFFFCSFFSPLLGALLGFHHQ